MKRRLLLPVVGIAALLSTAAAAAEPSLDASTFGKYRKAILPTAQELRWQEIPWRLGFWTGLVEAQAADKPLLLWMYGGTPAGVC